MPVPIRFRKKATLMPRRLKTLKGASTMTS